MAAVMRITQMTVTDVAMAAVFNVTMATVVMVSADRITAA